MEPCAEVLKPWSAQIRKDWPRNRPAMLLPNRFHLTLECRLLATARYFCSPLATLINQRLFRKRSGILVSRVLLSSQHTQQSFQVISRPRELEVLGGVRSQLQKRLQTSRCVTGRQEYLHVASVSSQDNCSTQCFQIRLFGLARSSEPVTVILDAVLAIEFP